MSTLISRASRPLRFGAVGIVNTLVGAGTIVVAKLGLGFGDVAANAAGYAVNDRLIGAIS
jgi:putative flippase GtrA